MLSETTHLQSNMISAKEACWEKTLTSIPVENHTITIIPKPSAWTWWEGDGSHLCTELVWGNIRYICIVFSTISWLEIAKLVTSLAYKDMDTFIHWSLVLPKYSGPSSVKVKSSCIRQWTLSLMCLDILYNAFLWPLDMQIFLACIYIAILTFSVQTVFSFIKQYTSKWLRSSDV